jgi:hypothetical protein
MILLGAWTIYHKASLHSRLNDEEKMNMVDYSFKQLDASLKPLTSEVTALQVSGSGLSRKVDALEEKASKLASAVEAQAKAIELQTRTVASINESVELRREQFNKVIDGYNKWYDEHRKDQEVISKLISGAENVLERFGILSEEVDEYLELLSEEDGRGREKEGTTQASARTGPEPPTGAGVPPTRGKLTREAGMANREKGNRAQLQFSETVLRSAAKLHTCSLKEGEPDYVFHDPNTRALKYVSAFKALTLSEDATKQRWIPKRKMLAETKVAMKYGLPLILFVQNLANGRIWAKVTPVDELKKLGGITTPLMLVDDDSASEKACRESLSNVLQLL